MINKSKGICQATGRDLTNTMNWGNETKCSKQIKLVLKHLIENNIDKKKEDNREP